MILIQFYHMQYPCLNCAPKNLKFRMFEYLIIQTKFQQNENKLNLEINNKSVKLETK
jgi:hypothetical protein